MCGLSRDLVMNFLPIPLTLLHHFKVLLCYNFFVYCADALLCQNLQFLASANLIPSLPLLSPMTDLCLSPSVPAEAQKLPYYAGYCHVRLMIHSLCTSHYLDLFITLVICINVVTMSLEHYDQPKVRTAPV